MTAAPATFSFEACDEAATARFGAALAAVLPDQAVIALHGTLGAGKTRLVQALAAALGVDRRDVISPTFVLVQEYEGRVPVYHFDAYRLSGPEEFWALGCEEYFAGPGICLIEWAERVADCLPAERLEVSIAVADHNRRRFDCSAIGERYRSVIERLTKSVGSGAPAR